MAKRSDFAQKLLDDLRLRKERMGMPTSGQHSAHSPLTGNSQGNSRWALRGSGEATRSRLSNTEVKKMSLGTRHHRSPSFEGTSHDIVPVGRTRNRDQGIDVSTALALALSNSGKLQNIELYSNAAMGNKDIMHHGSLNFREIDSNMLRTFPFLSTMQIREISKGIQQLSMILRACSNGVIIKRNAIDIGRELLKGAKDLEESLSMLVSLQDASAYMAVSKGKQIKLLKGKEDESSSEEVNKRKLMRPRFSFDRPSKQTSNHIREVSDYDLTEYKQMRTKSNSNKISSNSSLKFNYHRRSLSADPSSKPDAQFVGHANKSSPSEEIKNFTKDVNCLASTNIKHPSSKDGFAREKVRIPNVVAKLMGLEELPLAMPEVKKIELQNDPNPKQVKGRSKVKIDAEINQTTHSMLKMKEKDKRKRGIVETKEAIILELNNGKIMKNTKELNSPPAYSKVLHFSIGKTTDVASMDQCKEYKVAKNEASETWEKASTIQQTCENKIEQGTDAKQTLDLVYGISDHIVREHDKAQRNKDAVPKQQRNAQEENSIVAQQQPQIDRLKIKHTKQKNQENPEQNKRNKTRSIVARKKEVIVKNEVLSSSEMKTQKVSSCTSTTTVARSLMNKSDTAQAEEYQKDNHNEQSKLQKRNSAHHGEEGKLENELSEQKRPLKAVANTEKDLVVPLVSAPAIRKSIPNPPAQKVEVIKQMRSKNENKRISIKENIRMKTAEVKVQTMKQKDSFLHELEHRWKERTGKAKVIVASREMKLEHHSEEAIAPVNLLCRSGESEIPKLQDHIMTAEINVKARQEEPANPTQSDDEAITGSTALNPQEVSDKENLELLPLWEENKSEGPADRRQLSNCNSVGWQSIETSDVHGQGLLTDDEYNLKQILMSSQHFLNTAQALFKIKIPIGALKDIKNLYQNEVSKLVQDTGYEVMRRKAKREEAIFSSKMSFAPAKVRCLDDLIKELTDNICSLELSSTIEDTDIPEFLHKQIEIDIENKNPDVNCMWDICWNSMTFAIIEKEEITRDVEKHVLNVLISDLARDLMSTSTNV